jgi:hypothetical protein
MVKFYFLSILSLFSINSKSQSTFRFAINSAIWTQCEIQYHEGPQGTWGSSRNTTYRANGDSIINGLNYQRITPSYLCTEAFIRQDSSGKVFFLDSTLIKETLIYDFGLKKGDTLVLLNPYRFPFTFNSDTLNHFVVDSIDSVNYGGLKKRMIMRCLHSNYCSWFSQDIVIEGIGSLNSHFLLPYIYEFRTIPGNAFKMVRFDDRIMRYDFSTSCTVGISDIDAQKINIYPNPAIDYLVVSELESEASLILITSFRPCHPAFRHP